MKIFSKNIIKIKNKFYLFARDINLFYSVDFIDGQVSFISKLPEEQLLSKRLVSEIIYWKNELYFIPLNTNNIWIYSLKKEQWKKIIVKKYKNNLSNAYFLNAIIYKNNMFLFGGKYSAILKMDLATKDIIYIEKPFKEKNNKNLKDYYFRGKPLKIENILYLASCIDNSVLRFNMDTYDYQWIEVGSKTNQYSGIEKRGNDFWLAPRHNSHIVKWDGKDGSVEYKIDEKFQIENSYFSGITKKKDDLVIYTSRNKLYSLIIKKNEKIFLEKNKYIFYKETKGECIYQTMDGRIYYRNIDGTYRIYENEIEDEKIIRLLSQKNENMAEVMRKYLTEEGKPFSCKFWLNLLFDMKIG